MGAYNLTEKSGWGVESIMVSDLPVYRRNATSVTGWTQKRADFVAWVWNRERTEKLVNGKQHSVWLVPTGMNRLPQNVLFNFRLEFPKSDLTIYLPSGISEIFCQMVSKTARLHPGSWINRLCQQSLHVMIYVEKARVIERESNVMIYISPVLSVETLCLVISAANVVNCVISWSCWQTDFRYVGGARVTRILCTSMKTLCKCLVEVILS